MFDAQLTPQQESLVADLMAAGWGFPAAVDMATHDYTVEVTADGTCTRGPAPEPYVRAE